MKKILLGIGVLSIVFTACKKDDTTKAVVATNTSSSSTNSLNLSASIVTAPISSDANTISQSIKTSGGERISGTVPAQTSGAGTPSIQDPFSNEKVTVFSGAKVGLPITITDGENDIKGLFVQVDGATDYLKVPISSLRTRTSNSGPGASSSTSTTNNLKTIAVQELAIELPADFGIGEFCVTYCVYDAENNVSNYVTKCIVVTELGGNANFVKNWSLTSMTIPGFDSIFNPTAPSTKPIPGVIFEYSNSITCEDGTQKTLTYSSSINSFTFNLQANGAFVMNYNSSNTGFGDAGTTTAEPCSMQSTTTTEETITIGGWSYNETTKKLALIYQSQTQNGVTTELNDAFELTVDSHTTSQLDLADSESPTTKYVFN